MRSAPTSSRRPREEGSSQARVELDRPSRIEPFLMFSADSHVDEPEDDLVAQLPLDLRPEAPRFTTDGDACLRLVPGLGALHEDIARRYVSENATADELRREFRNDSDGGRNLERRAAQQGDDGVGAELIFPNRYLALPAHPNASYQMHMSRIYNDFVVELFSPAPLMMPAGVLPIADITAAVYELQRVAELGIRGAMLPPSVPWRPYSLADYDPLWRAFADTGTIALFHVFADNTAYGADFSNALALTDLQLTQGRKGLAELGYDRIGQQHNFLGLAHTVMGMAAGMSPLLHLTGSGALDRFPGMRFAIVEAEAGWLPFALTAMDHNQDRRPEIRRLALRASDYFRRQGYITFSMDPASIAQRYEIGVDRLLWANDYPHDEGTYPHSRAVIADLLEDVPDAERSALLWENSASLFGLGPELVLS